MQAGYHGYVTALLLIEGVEPLHMRTKLRDNGFDVIKVDPRTLIASQRVKYDVQSAAGHVNPRRQMDRPIVNWSIVTGSDWVAITGSDVAPRGWWP